MMNAHANTKARKVAIFAATRNCGEVILFEQLWPRGLVKCELRIDTPTQRQPRGGEGRRKGILCLNFVALANSLPVFKGYVVLELVFSTPEPALVV